MRYCKCGHSQDEHENDGMGECYSCDCPKFISDENYEPPDPPGWEGGFAWNH